MVWGCEFPRFSLSDALRLRFPNNPHKKHAGRASPSSLPKELTPFPSRETFEVSPSVPVKCVGAPVKPSPTSWLCFTPVFIAILYSTQSRYALGHTRQQRTPPPRNLERERRPQPSLLRVQCPPSSQSRVLLDRPSYHVANFFPSSPNHHHHHVAFRSASLSPAPSRQCSRLLPTFPHAHGHAHLTQRASVYRLTLTQANVQVSVLHNTRQ